jgi:hypothetical protein
VTGNTGLENFPAAGGRIRCIRAASGEIQSAQQEQQDADGDSVEFGLVESAHDGRKGVSKTRILAAENLEDKLNFKKIAHQM